MSSVHHTETNPQPSLPSMRRTLLTLFAAFCAFGVLTASYATAELPAGDSPAMQAADVSAR
ncbi:hypothetical protein GCM10011390_05620 [Aureimonas endophytica]|uniref:Uncharacterized protein n=1 Tax=Aureimonas endophytica TaxID=2027858 RepID=A0A917E1K4_9HYPH|nr:hypothetical protein GCM10011390_05620 [Aureimonas endophytica]